MEKVRRAKVNRVIKKVEAANLKNRIGNFTNCAHPTFTKNRTDMRLQRPSYIPPYSRRKDFSRKIRDTEKQINELKNKNQWTEVSRLCYLLRNSWWGYKRYNAK